MMGIVDPTDGTLRISRIVMIDVVVILLLACLIIGHVTTIYLTALIGYPALLVSNFLIIWRYSNRRVSSQPGGNRVSKLALFSVAVFTIANVVQIAEWVKEPGIRSATQAIGSTVLAGYIWFLVFGSRRRKKSQERQ